MFLPFHLYLVSLNPALAHLASPLIHLGDRSWRDVKGELLEEGETPSILPGDPVDEHTLLRLPSSSSGLGLRESIQREYTIILIHIC